MPELLTLEETAERFALVDWFVPAYLRLGVVRPLALEIERAPESDRYVVFENALPELYSADNLAAMVVHRYRTLPEIAPFSAVIEQAIESFYLGLPAVA